MRLRDLAWIALALMAAAPLRAQEGDLEYQWQKIIRNENRQIIYLKGKGEEICLIKE